jgi:ATPase subunit of ABC transporter with duplicated ATPase domains
MVGNPGILLLDELDAHLDPDGRRVFRQVLASYPGTVVFTSHDPLTTQLAATVWSLDVDGINGIGRSQLPATPAAGAVS